MSISLEEAGDLIRFADVLVSWTGTGFRIKPYFLNSPTSHKQFTQPRVRFVPEHLQVRKISYLRSLILGRVRRCRQISTAQEDLERGLWELLAELHRGPLRYSWDQLFGACQGIRPDWAQAAVQKTRQRISFLLFLDGR